MPEGKGIPSRRGSAVSALQVASRPIFCRPPAPAASQVATTRGPISTDPPSRGDGVGEPCPGVLGDAVRPQSASGFGRSPNVAPWREVIGVVGGVSTTTVSHEPAPATSVLADDGESHYRAETGGGRPGPRRSPSAAQEAGTEGLLSQLRAAVWSVNSSLPLTSTRTMQEIYDRRWREPFTLVMLAIAGAMALVLGVVGIYGVISYAVSQRTREIGIRLALGAQRSELKRMFLRHGLMLAASGMAIGLGAAVGLTGLMSSLYCLGSAHSTP